MAKFVWKQPYGRVRFDEGVLPLLQDAAERVAEECGDGYVATPAEQGRWGGGRVAVVTSNAEAIRSEAKHHHLARFS